MADLRNGKFVAVIIGVLLSGAFTLIGSWLVRLENEAGRLQQEKADKADARDRWTNSQMDEYKAYVESRLTQLQKECDRISRNEAH